MACAAAWLACAPVLDLGAQAAAGAVVELSGATEVARDAVHRVAVALGTDALAHRFDARLSEAPLATLASMLGSGAVDQVRVRGRLEAEPSDSVQRCQGSFADRRATMCRHIAPRDLVSIMEVRAMGSDQVLVEVLVRRWRGPAEVLTGSSSAMLVYRRVRPGTWTFHQDLGGKAG